MYKGLIFSESLLPMKYLKPCLSKGNVLGTTIVLISIFFMEIGLLYWWNLYSSISVSSNFIIFYPFLHVVLTFFIIFYNAIFHLN